MQAVLKDLLISAKDLLISAIAAALTASIVFLILGRVFAKDFDIIRMFTLLTLFTAFFAALVLGVPLLLLHRFIKFGTFTSLVTYLFSGILGIVLAFGTLFGLKSVFEAPLEVEFWCFYGAISSPASMSAWYFAVYGKRKLEGRCAHITRQ